MVMFGIASLEFNGFLNWKTTTKSRKKPTTLIDYLFLNKITLNNIEAVQTWEYRTYNIT